MKIFGFWKKALINSESWNYNSEILKSQVNSQKYKYFDGMYDNKFLQMKKPVK